jgi:hypothetical protein
MQARAALTHAASAFTTVRRSLLRTPSSAAHNNHRSYPIAKQRHSPIATMAASDADAAGLVGDVFFLDEFAMRQWDDPAYGGTRIAFDKAEFVKRIHEAHANGGAAVQVCVCVCGTTKPKTSCYSITETTERWLYKLRSPQLETARRYPGFLHKPLLSHAPCTAYATARGCRWRRGTRRSASTCSSRTLPG